MNFRWLGPLVLLAVLVIGDQIRINRPGHKYRLTVEVETPEGTKSTSGVLAVQPDRGYKTVEVDGMNYLALRAYNAAGRKVSFNDMSRMTGPVPVQGALIPVLVTFADPGDPATARVVPPDGTEAALGKGFHLRGISTEVVPNGFWPLDFSGPFGEPVTRGIEAKLPWWSRPDDPARKALQAAGLQGGEAIDPKQVFTRK